VLVNLVLYFDDVLVLVLVVLVIYSILFCVALDMVLSWVIDC